MRHGQGYHGAAQNGHDLRDPHLTGHGEQQCREQRDKFQRHDKIDLLLASPLRRALQTCSIAFQPCLDRGLKIIALPMAEEASDAPCDTGSEPEGLKEEFPNAVDFDSIKHNWWVHEGEYATDPKTLIARAAKLRRWIKARPEKEVVLVAHGFFNHFLTGEVDIEGNQTTPWWNEAELRTYTFDEDTPAYVGGGKTVDGEDAAMIKETDESLKRLGERKASTVQNVNRPAERKKSLANYQKDVEVAA